MSADPRTLLLQRAQEKVTGKADNYDTPERSFSRIAYLWAWWLDVNVSERDVAAMMLLLKVSRLYSDPEHYDSLLDLAGYAACWAELLPKGPAPEPHSDCTTTKVSPTWLLEPAVTKRTGEPITPEWPL